MDFSEMLKAMNQASSFELYRLNAMIEQVLDEPERNERIKAQLKVGQEVEYFDPVANGTCQGKIVRLLKKNADILNYSDQTHWRMPYASINVNGIDTQVTQEKPRGVGRAELAVGDQVGFTYHGEQKVGVIKRLNTKSVTLDAQGEKWRVGYSLLQRVVDSEASEGRVISHQ